METIETKEEETLPSTCTFIEKEDVDIYILGTAHVSKQSVDDTIQCFSIIQPNCVMIELCSKRINIINMKDSDLDVSFFEIYQKSGNLMSSLLSYFNISIAKKLGTLPGLEFKTAYEEALKCGSSIILCDRPVNITLSRLWAFLPLWSKIKVTFSIFYLLFYNLSSQEVEELKGSNMEELILEFSKEYPELSEVLIKERDIYMSKVIIKFLNNIKKQKELIKKNKLLKEIEEIQEIKIQETIQSELIGKNDEIKEENHEEIKEEIEEIEEQKEKLLVVVGMGHVSGIKNYLQNPSSIEEIREIPKSSKTLQKFKWILILFFLYFIIKFFWK